MKHFILILGLSLFALESEAQFTDAQKQYLSSDNLLKNPGFENGKASWTLTSGTSAVETSNVKQGKQSLKLEMTSDILDFFQTSTLNATAFADGVNGSISLAVKTTVSNVYLCRTDSAGAVVASTNGTEITNCVKAPNTGKWSDLVMPIVLGASQNGLKLVSLTPSTALAVTVTGDVFVDSGILEAGLKTQVVNNVGPWNTYAPTISSSTGSITNYTPSFRWRQVGEQIEVSGVMTFSAASAAFADVLITLPTGYTMTAAGAAIQSIGYGASFDVSSNYYPFTVFVNTTSRVILYQHTTATHTGNAPVGIQSMTNAIPFTFNTSDSISVNFTVPVTQFSNSSSVYTASCGANCADTFSAKVPATGTPLTENTDFINGSCTYATGAWTCNFNSGIFTNAPSCNIEILTGATAVSSIITAVSSSAISFVTLTVGAANVQSAFDIICQKQGADFVASRTIVGSFNEVVTSIGTTSPDIQSVYITTLCSTGTCVISNQVGNKITSVTWSSTGNYLVNGIDGTKYNCVANSYDSLPKTMSHSRVWSAATYATISSVSTTNTYVNTGLMSIICHGKP